MYPTLALIGAAQWLLAQEREKADLEEFTYILNILIRP